MVSTQAIIAFIIAGVCTLILPVAVVIFLGIKRKISMFPLLIGAAAFFISQIVLRIPILNALAGQNWYIDFTRNFIPYVFALSLTAGLFEESARLGGALILKKQRSFKDIFSFGLGHGLCEVIILVGFTHINNIIFSTAVNNPGGALALSLDPNVLVSIAPQMIALNSFHVYLGILERVFAVTFHVFATFLVFKGVIEKKWIYYVYAILAHTVLNFVSVLTAYYAGLIAAQIALLVMAVPAGVYVWRLWRAENEDISKK
ncbi:MAG: YhfC family intramembrane metalloprotease [Lachnospiraceae bacterium]|nr:YhfC family intramembrane metalloprotease [Lachnospiraceae bacterium]